jgi:sulfite reductase (NADPH) flavoprotein alpha-component
VSSTPTIPENAPFTAEQRLWLNGYLAGLVAGSAARHRSSAQAEAASAGGAVKVLILYGSQTGTAEGLARRIAKQANARGCQARVLDAAAHKDVNWRSESHLLVITSTYGDGEMPDNAQGFWEWLRSDAAGVLAHVSYSVLALGDTNYAEFCAAGKAIDARFEELGAKRLHARFDCDVDYEAKAQEWVHGSLGALLDAGAALAAPPRAIEATVTAEGYSKARPFPARLLASWNLTGEGSGKETRHFEIGIDGSGLTYEAGDALGIHPCNCPALVNDLLAALDRDGEEAVPVPRGQEWPLRKALAEFYDITKPSQELLRHVAETNEELRALLLPDRREDLKQWLVGREVIDVVMAARGANFEPAAFAALLKKLTPRLYSISSSPKAHAGQAHLTVGIVRHDSHGRPRKGVCSTFLADRVTEGASVPVFVQTSHGFRLPADGSTPVIMVGPGTGVAPFRGFLHERRATGARGRNWLFFGEQRAATDFYYREEFEVMLADGHLTQLSTAFSRDQAEKIYVQHRITERAAQIWAWLQEGAHFYVCGDASRMAKDVDAALHAACETVGGLSKDAAMEFVQKLKTEKRYQRDIY